MRSLRKHIRLSAGVLIAASVSLAATACFAMPRYDGLWSVSIVTKKGDCIASYRYPMRIEKGVLANGGDIVLNISGKVADNGAIRVAVSHGDSRAIGLGHLSGTSGSGFWSGASCSGSWTAERRNS